MWFPESGSRRVMYLYVVVLILVLLQIFGVGAIRVFPPNNNAVPNKVQFSHRIIFDDNNTNTNTRNRYEDLFKRYFAGRTTSAPTTNDNNNTTTTAQTGFDDSKRRVPSCPDPLHN